MGYYPDCWVIAKITNGTNIIYKVLGGWSGGYLQGTSWRMNSGISGFYVQDDVIIFEGYSGSRYHCHVDGEGIKMANAGIIEDFAHRFKEAGLPATIEQIFFEQFVEEFN